MTLPSEAGTALTLGDLVTHRSGLADDPPNLDKPCEGRIMCNPKALYDRGFLWQGLEAPGALRSVPGTAWLYSDFGFGTLGTLMADAFEPGRAQPPFGNVVRRELTGPLGMTATALESPTADLAPNPAQPDMQMGMGWQLYPAAGAAPAHAFKNGGATGSTSATFLVPTQGWAVTVLNNGHNMDLVSAATKDLMRTLAPNDAETAADGSGSSSWGSSGS